MKVFFFGRLKDITGTKTIELENFRKLSELKEFLFHKFPELRKQTFSISVNFEIVSEDIELKENDEIALLPPISGGCPV